MNFQLPIFNCRCQFKSGRSERGEESRFSIGNCHSEIGNEEGGKHLVVS